MIAVIRAAALGDVLLTLPAIRALRVCFPGTPIKVAGYPSIWEVAGPLVDEVVSIDSPIFAGLYADETTPQLAGWLRDVDLLIAWSARDLGAGVRASGVPIIYASPYPPPGTHAADWLLHSIADVSMDDIGRDLLRRSAGLPTHNVGMREPRGTQRVPPQEVPTASITDKEYHSGAPAPRDITNLLALTAAELGSGRTALHRHGLENPVILHPGAGAAWKRWPAERFAQLASALLQKDHRVALLEGPADAAVVGDLQRLLARPLPVIREPSVRRLAAVLAHASVFVGNDSGVTHLAAMAGAPIIALFGPTDPVCWAPIGDVQILRACITSATEQGQIRVCNDAECMAALPLDEVIRAVEDSSAGCSKLC